MPASDLLPRVVRMLGATVESSQVVRRCRQIAQGSVVWRALTAILRGCARSLSVRSSWLVSSIEAWRPSDRDFQASKALLWQSILVRALDRLFLAVRLALPHAGVHRLGAAAPVRSLAAAGWTEAAGWALGAAAVAHGLLTWRTLFSWPLSSPLALGGWALLVAISVLLVARAGAVTTALGERIRRSAR